MGAKCSLTEILLKDIPSSDKWNILNIYLKYRMINKDGTRNFKQFNKYSDRPLADLARWLDIKQRENKKIIFIITSGYNKKINNLLMRYNPIEKICLECPTEEELYERCKQRKFKYKPIKDFNDWWLGEYYVQMAIPMVSYTQAKAKLKLLRARIK